MYFANKKHFERFKELVITFSFRNSEKEKEFNVLDKFYFYAYLV